MTWIKYKIEKHQIYSGGTWVDTTPPETRKTEIGEYSTFSGCSGYDIMYRWITLSGATDYICSGTTKMAKEQKQQSLDEGVTWMNVVPAEYRAGGIIEESSLDCVYYDGKLRANYSGGAVLELPCDSSSSGLTSGETRPSGYTYTSMTDAVIGNCCNEIGYEAFYFCSSLTSVTIPNTVTTIGRLSFAGDSGLTSIYIPNGVTTIGRGAFEYCSGLTNVTISNSVTTIDQFAFDRCHGIPNINIPNGVTTINDFAFQYCTGLTSVTISDSVSTINNYAFFDCRRLASITIGSGVTTIGKDCFWINETNYLSAVTINATTPPTLVPTVYESGTVYSNFNWQNPNLRFYVPSSSVNSYKSATGWNTFADRIQAIPT